MTKELSDSASFIRAYGTDEFKPFALYDKHLDCIRVRIRDCSIIEERLSRIFTVLKASHSEIEEYVGFNIKGVRHLLEELGLPSEGVFTLTDIISGIVKKYPDKIVKMVLEEFYTVIEDNPLSVEVDYDLAA